MKHFIAMGGSRGCMPDNCQAYISEKDAIEGLELIYELYDDQIEELRQTESVNLTPEQGGEYCEISECNCDTPWIHAEFDTEENWEGYL